MLLKESLPFVIGPMFDFECCGALQAIPRVTSQGMVCGAVYRVASESTLAPSAGVY